VLTIAAPSLLALVGWFWAANANAQEAPGEERLLGAEVAPAGVSFRVLSSGCTRKANFGVETLSLHPLTLRLVRVTPDYCEASQPKGTVITFGFSEIGAGPKLTGKDLQDVIIVNERMPVATRSIAGH
jgi:hypothetical protein